LQPDRFGCAVGIGGYTCASSAFCQYFWQSL
jgi:hypothetical protein